MTLRGQFQFCDAESYEWAGGGGGTLACVDKVIPVCREITNVSEIRVLCTTGASLKLHNGIGKSKNTLLEEEESIKFRLNLFMNMLGAS